MHMRRTSLQHLQVPIRSRQIDEMIRNNCNKHMHVQQVRIPAEGWSPNAPRSCLLRKVLVAAVCCWLYMLCDTPRCLALPYGWEVPPRAWSSWNSFRENVSDALLRQSGDALTSSPLYAAGYRSIWVDDGWSGCDVYQQGAYYVVKYCTSYSYSYSTKYTPYMYMSRS